MYYYLCYIRIKGHMDFCCFIGVRANDEDHARNEASIYLANNLEVAFVERYDP